MTTDQPAGVVIGCACGLTLDLKTSPTEGYWVKCPKCGALHLQTPREGKRVNVFVNWIDDKEEL
jgi:transcription elongation factor Elf1